eukprot:403336380
MFGGDWFLQRWDPFSLNQNPWRQFEMMDRMLDRTFDKFENEMFQNRNQMLQSQDFQQRQIQPESSTYEKSYHSVDSREEVIDGKRIKYRTLETTKEKDGVKIPHTLREIQCDPPCDLETLQKCITFREDVGGQQQNVFKTFLEDAKKKNLAPQRIVKYQNEVKHNAETNKNDYLINVSFLDKDNQKHVYEWCKKQDAIEAETRIDDPKMLQSSEGQQQQLQQNQPGWQTSQYSVGGQQQQLSSQGAISGQQQQQKEIGTGASQQYMGSGQHQQAPHLSKDLGSQGTQQNVTKEQFQQKNLPKQMQL